MHRGTYVLVVAAALVGSMASVPLGVARGQAPGGPPSGRYVATVADADLPPDVTGALRQGLPGRWELELTVDGRYRSSKDGEARAEGRFAAAGEELTLSSETGPAACAQPGQATATYRWAFHGQRLTFTPVGDACRARAVSLSAVPWTLQTAAPAGSGPAALPRSGTGMAADARIATSGSAALVLLAAAAIVIGALPLRRAHRQRERDG